MTVTLRIVLVLVSFLTFYRMMRKIRQAKVQIESAIFWIVLALVLVMFSVFPRLADWAARLLGIYSTANFLFLFAIFLLIVKVFSMTIHISQLETKVKELVQQMALDKRRHEEEQWGRVGPEEKQWDGVGPEEKQSEDCQNDLEKDK